MNKGYITIFKEAFVLLSHFFDAEIISLAEINTMSIIAATNPPFGKPTSDISEIALVEPLDIIVVASIFYNYLRCKEYYILFLWYAIYTYRPYKNYCLHQKIYIYK